MSNTPLVARSRTGQHAPTEVRVGAIHADARDIVIGNGGFVVAAGPCSVEGGAMLLETAHAVSGMGAPKPVGSYIADGTWDCTMKVRRFTRAAHLSAITALFLFGLGLLLVGHRRSRIRLQ